MDQITTSSTSPQINQADRIALVNARNSLVGGDLTERLAPAFRRRLEAFAADTDRYLVDARTDQVETEISTLMLNFHTARSMSKGEASIVMREYVDALRGLPLWAIRRGIRRVKDGEVEGASLDFPPAAPRLRKVVTEVMEPLLVDRLMVKRVLSAKEPCVEDPEMAARTRKVISEGLKRRSAELAAADTVVAGPKPPTFKAMQGAELAAHYRNHGFLFQPKPPQRNDDRNTLDETFHEDGTVGRRAVGG